MVDFTAADKLKELKRERAMRHNVYPKRIGAGHMTQAQADKAMAILDAIIADYEAKAQAEESQGRLL